MSRKTALNIIKRQQQTAKGDQFPSFADEFSDGTNTTAEKRATKQQQPNGSATASTAAAFSNQALDPFVIDTHIMPEKFTPEEIENCKKFYNEYIAANYPDIHSENRHAVRFVPNEPRTDGRLLVFCSGTCCKRRYASSNQLHHVVVPGIFYAHAHPDRLKSSGAYVDAVVKLFEGHVTQNVFKTEVDAYATLFLEELLCRASDRYTITTDVDGEFSV